MNKVYASMLFFILLAMNVHAQKMSAKDVVDISQINSLLKESFQQGKFCSAFECRFVDPKNASRYVLVGIMEGSEQLLVMDRDMNRKNIDTKKKAIGIYDTIKPYEKGGNGAYYMTAPKGTYNAEAFLFKFTKGKYLVTFGAEGVSTGLLQQSMDAIYKLLTAKL